MHRNGDCALSTVQLAWIPHKRVHFYCVCYCGTSHAALPSFLLLQTWFTLSLNFMLYFNLGPYHFHGQTWKFKKIKPHTHTQGKLSLSMFFKVSTIWSYLTYPTPFPHHLKLYLAAFSWPSTSFTCSGVCNFRCSTLFPWGPPSIPSSYSISNDFSDRIQVTASPWCVYK